MRRVFFRGNKVVFELDGKEVTEKQYNKGWVTPPPDYEKGECCTVQPDHNDFSSENGGRGRYNPQLAKKPNDPNAYVKNVNEVKSKAKRAGLTAHTS